MTSHSTKELSKVAYRIWITLGITILSVLIALIAINNEDKVTALVTTMTYPANRVNSQVREGDVVSIDKNGNLKQGAGTTVYRNIQEIQNKTMYHLHTVIIGDNIHIAQYDSEMLVSVVDPDTDELIATEVYTLPLIDGRQHRIDDLIVIDGNLVLSLGDTKCVPCRVSYENDKINVEFGNITQPIPISNIQPEMMILNDTCVVISYYGVKNRITLVAGCLKSDNHGMDMQWGDIHEYSDNYIFHDIVGINGEKFMVVHARVPWFSYKSHSSEDLTGESTAQRATDSRLRYGLGTLHANLSVSVGEIHIIEKKSFGFMDMARLDEENVVLTFINEDYQNAMESILFKYSKTLDKIYMTSSIFHQDGGAQSTIGGLYSFIRTRAFSPTRFGVYYADVAAMTTPMLSLVDVTPAGDLVPFGPEFSIAPPARDLSRSYYWTNLAPSTAERFFVMESITTHGGSDWPHGEIHVGEIYGFPLGIVTSMSSKEAVVAIDGVVETKKTLVEGKEYYANSNGKLVEGDYYGKVGFQTYPIYACEDDRDQILSTDNRIGLAISEHQLLFRIPDIVEVCYSCYKCKV